MSPEQIAAAAAILLAAYFIRGITGFGSGLISVPLLALFLPLQFVVPLVLLLDFHRWCWAACTSSMCCGTRSGF